MAQNASIRNDQPPATPAAAGEPEPPAHRTPGRVPLDEHLTLGEYVTPEQLAQHLGKSTRTLARWHARRIGPPRCSVGKLILYRVGAVCAWMAECETVPVAPGKRHLGGGRRG